MGWVYIIIYALAIVGMMVFLAYLLSKQNEIRAEKMVLHKGDTVKIINTRHLKGKVISEDGNGQVKVEILIHKTNIYEDV